MEDNQLKCRRALKQPWYASDWFVILLLLLFSPLGLYWMWKHATWRTSSKWLHTVFLGLPLLLFFLWWSRVVVTWVAQIPSGRRSLSDVATQSEEPTETFPSDPFEWSSYTNDKLGFTIKYPKTWLLTEPRGDNKSLNLLSLSDTNLECLGTVNMNTPKAGESLFPSDVVDASTTDSIRTNDGAVGERTVGKTASYRREVAESGRYGCKVSGEYLAQRIVFKSRTHTYAFDVYYASGSKNAGVFLKILDEILKTFKIKNPSPISQ